MSELLEHRVLPSILPLEKWTASSQYPKERRYSTYMAWFVADIREKAREIVWADENVPLSKSEPDPEDEDWVYGSFYNDDLEMDDTLAMILSKPGVHVDGLIMAGWCVVNEARQSGIRPFFDYKQFAGKLPRFAKTLKIRELCYQARQTLKQEKVDRLPDVPRLDDDIRMADLLVPLLKKDQHDIQLAMKQARKTILLDIAECRGLHHVLSKANLLNVVQLQLNGTNVHLRLKLKNVIPTLGSHPSFTLAILQSLIIEANKICQTAQLD